jgi:hypothetical protein
VVEKQTSAKIVHLGHAPAFLTVSCRQNVLCQSLISFCSLKQSCFPEIAFRPSLDCSKVQNRLNRGVIVPSMDVSSEASCIFQYQNLGKLGGAKSGRARAAKMTKEERSESARQAAKARWDKKRLEEESS